MKCQNCGENEANVRYTQVINGVKKEMILCEECSEKIGLNSLDFSMPINFSSFLGDFWEEAEDFLPSYIQKEELKCTECGMTYEEFTNIGKFGCEKCPEKFKNKLDRILQNVHGTYNHSGRRYESLEIGNKVESKENKIDENKEKLKEEQAKAIKEERYEDAAKIRDKIKKLEK